jgi:Protein of unknown function (DUF2795)
MSKPSPIDLQRDLKGISYPATRDELIRCAEQNHADQSVTEKLKSLSKQRFEGPDDVSKEIFGK